MEHPQLHEVTITALGHGAEGVARLPDGRVVFVDGVAPGDVVAIRLTVEHATWARAELTQVLSPSPHRREPRCLHHRQKQCGGCAWQHVTVEEQRAQKEALIRREAQRVCPTATVKGIVGVSEWGYRRRARFGHRGWVLGYRARGERRVFDLVECPTLHPTLEAAIPDIRQAAAQTPDGNFDAMVTPDGALRFGRDATPFAQPSLEAELLLVAEVLAAIPPSATHIVELFAGAGTFTVPLLQRGHALSAYEGDRATVNRLRKNAPSATAYQADLLGAPPTLPHCDVVLLDPPRAGAAPCIEAIAATAAPLVVYVSCEPATLFRDLAALGQHGYAVETIAPFDAFPQTPHIETVVVCRRALPSANEAR